MIQISWATETTREQPEGGDAYDFSFAFLNLDILEQENYDSRSMVTKHAVEEGIPVSDHIVLEADRVNFTAIVSGRQSITTLVEDARHGTTEFESGLEASGIVVPEGTDRIGDVFSQLLELKNNGTKISISGLQRDIDDWIIESISSPRTVPTAGLLVCQISVTEIRTAVLEEIDAPSPRVERGRNGSDSGTTSTEDANPTEEAESESTLSQMRDGVQSGKVQRLFGL